MTFTKMFLRNKYFEVKRLAKEIHSTLKEENGNKDNSIKSSMDITWPKNKSYERYIEALQQ